VSEVRGHSEKWVNAELKRALFRHRLQKDSRRLIEGQVESVAHGEPTEFDCLVIQAHLPRIFGPAGVVQENKMRIAIELL
jgi:hypothetical protein